ncbi:hypothetical protein, partial [Pseudomonas syringae]
LAENSNFIKNLGCRSWVSYFENSTLVADSVEKVALLFGLGQNHSIGQRENTQHDGTVIEWAGAAVLLVQH